MADDPKPGHLRNLRVERVAIVDVGANFDKATGDGAHIMLFKRHITKDGPSLGSVHADSPDWDDQDADEYEKADLTGPKRRALPDSAFAAVWTDSDGKKHRKLPIHDAGHLAAARGRIDAASIPASVKAAARRKIEAATKDNTKEKNVKKSLFKSLLGLIPQTDANKAQVAEVTKAVDDMDEDDMKKAAHDPEDKMCKCADCMEKRKSYTGDPKVVEGIVAKALEDVQKKHDAEVAVLKASIAKEQDARLDHEMRTVLKSFRHVSVDLDKDVAVFRKMKQADPAGYDRHIEMLKAADDQLSMSKSFEQVGSGRSGGRGDAWKELVALAKKNVTKGANGVTLEQAIDDICMDPDNAVLVKRYRDEQN